jgi:hypothetical protein
MTHLFALELHFGIVEGSCVDAEDERVDHGLASIHERRGWIVRGNSIDAGPALAAYLDSIEMTEAEALAQLEFTQTGEPA